jgi:hypothetical protein
LIGSFANPLIFSAVGQFSILAQRRNPLGHVNLLSVRGQWPHANTLVSRIAYCRFG